MYAEHGQIIKLLRILNEFINAFTYICEDLFRTCIWLPASVENVEYSGYDEKVISVDPDYGIIMALSTGTTKIKLSSTSYGEDGWEHPIIHETEVTVTVREKEDPEPDAGEKADRNSVRTGDYENLYSWVALLTLSSLLLALTAVIRKKRH